MAERAALDIEIDVAEGRAAKRHDIDRRGRSEVEFANRRFEQPRFAPRGTKPAGFSVVTPRARHRASRATGPDRRSR